MQVRWSVREVSIDSGLDKGTHYFASYKDCLIYMQNPARNRHIHIIALEKSSENTEWSSPLRAYMASATSLDLYFEDITGRAQTEVPQRYHDEVRNFHAHEVTSVTNLVTGQKKEYKLSPVLALTEVYLQHALEGREFWEYPKIIYGMRVEVGAILLQCGDWVAYRDPAYDSMSFNDLFQLAESILEGGELTK